MVGVESEFQTYEGVAGTDIEVDIGIKLGEGDISGWEGVSVCTEWKKR